MIAIIFDFVGQLFSGISFGKMKDIHEEENQKK